MTRYGTFWVDTASEDQKLFDLELAKRIFGYTTGLRHWLLVAAISAPLVGGIQLARPWLLKQAVDNAILPGNVEQLILYAGLFLAVLAAELGGMFGQLMLLQWIGQRVLLRLRTALFRKVLSLDQRYFSRVPSGVTLTRLTNDLEAIQELFAAGIVTLVTDVVKLVGIMGVMLWLNARLALITFCVLPLLYVVSEFFRRKLRRAYRNVRQAVAGLNAQLSTTVEDIEDVQGQHLEPDLARRFADVNDRHRRANLDSILNDAVLYASVEMLSSIVIGALIWFGGREYLEGRVTLGVLVAFVEYVQMFFVPIRDLSAKYAVLQSAFASAEKVFGLIDTQPAVTDPENPKSPRPEGRAAMADVHFGYKPDVPVLRGIDFEAPPRGFIAIVGPTGHGKSTIVRLLRREYDVDSGAVLLDGVDIRQLELDDVRRRTLAVSQRTFLFGGNVRDNLALADDFDDDAMCEVLDTVGFRPRTPRPAVLDAVVSEGGRNLSMGERQLLALARVLLRDPEIMILDEATAHIDSETEGSLYRVLRQQHGARTMIAIAHRLSTIREADEILLVRHGRIEERGTHEQLIAQSGVYANLIRLHDLEAAGEGE
ncbi:MAG: ABC transporter ATP-binding protein [Candidatus Dadabacteria bacterium]|nr:MAG: ABC transporter ATP-binding protein [Candidatus Dadabacteria bacterium]